jgi:hypothetical protein
MYYQMTHPITTSKVETKSVAWYIILAKAKMMVLISEA